MVCYFTACCMRKGCHSLICDTDQSHSNCMEWFKSAYGIPAAVKVTSTNGAAMICFQATNQPLVDEARIYLNAKQRCCEEKHCTHVGNFHELQKHAEVNHPYSCPSKTDPLPELDWENVQRSSDIVNVFSTIHPEVPRAVTMPLNLGIQK